MAGGRPIKFDKEKIAKAMLKWAAKDTSLNLNAFCTTHDPIIPPKYISEWARGNEEFSVSYEVVKAFLAARREQKLHAGALHVKAYDLNIAVYDHFVKEERREQKEHEIGLKTKSETESQDNFARKIAQAVNESDNKTRQ